MASTNVTSLHTRIQFSVDQAVKDTGASFVSTRLDTHNADTQATSYNLKCTQNGPPLSDVPSSTLTTTTNTTPVTPSINSNMASKEQFGHIKLDISNSVLPYAKLVTTPSSNDGIPEDTEHQIRSLGCELIQLAGKLLKLPQVRIHEFIVYICGVFKF